jgi:phosphatidate cytidylyltransferase
LTTPPTFRANLIERVATAVVALPALAAALFLAPPLVGVAVVAGAVLIGLWEYFALLRARQVEPRRLTGLLLAAVAFAELARLVPVTAPLWIAGVLVLLAAAVKPGADLTATVPATAATLLGAVYLGGLGGTLAALRVLEPSALGAWRLVLLLAIIMVSDTCAFFVGHAFGRHKLAPLVSPGKTVEGGVGGLVGGIAGALAVRQWGLPALPVADAIVLGLLVSALGIAGDLFESLLKRWAGVKDSGNLFPGHGGMLDRLDSLLFGAPVLYYYFVSYAR